MAGYGTRMRPHTWSRPKQLLRVANNTMLGHVLETLNTLPGPENVELIFIVGYLGEQMEPYMQANYPHLKVHYAIQAEMKGQSHAIYMTRDLLDGPMMMIFADTLVETDLTFLKDEIAGGVAWVKEVPDPRRFGVVEVGDGGWVTRLIEKPATMENNLAVVGFYYFADSLDLIAAIEEQIRRDVQLKGEYFLVDAINIMLERGLMMRTHSVDTWLDAGTPEATLETNRFLLENGRDNKPGSADCPGVTIVPPVYIHPSAEVMASVIGPHAAIGAGCHIRDSVIHNSILEDEVDVTNAILENSLVGRRARVLGQAGIINIGDDAVVSV